MRGGLYHLHKRKREGVPLSGLDRLMYMVALVAPFVLLPQVAEVWLHRNAGGISVPTWLGLGFVNALWVLYGIKHREPPIVISSGFITLINFAVALGAILYR